MRKIMLMGLDNAGKTSIVLNLKGNKSLMSYLSLSPTKNHDIINLEIMDNKFNIWDLAGQEEYRQNHFEKFEDYVKGCDKLIYVIDIQDYERYDKAVDYLKDTMNFIKDLKINFDLSIFLHKYDPQILQSNPDIEQKVDFLVEKIRTIIPKYLNYKIFKTTIYTTFEKTPIFI